jgi:hypothetical protein
MLPAITPIGRPRPSKGRATATRGLVIGAAEDFLRLWRERSHDLAGAKPSVTAGSQWSIVSVKC